jgi:hypothetical protein
MAGAAVARWLDVALFRLLLAAVALAALIAGLANFALALATSQAPASLFVSHPLTLLAAVYLVTQYLTPRLMSRQSRAESNQREQSIRASGPLLASTRSGGHVGRLDLRNGQLRIEVYPGGILLKTILLPSCAVLTSEIRAIRTSRRGLFATESVELQVSSPLLRSPITLEVGPASEVARAIEQITGLPSRPTPPT